MGCSGVHEQQATVLADLEALKVELASVQEGHELAKKDAAAAADEHARKLQEAEDGYVAKQGELSKQLQKITTELEV